MGPVQREWRLLVLHTDPRCGQFMLNVTVSSKETFKVMDLIRALLAKSTVLIWYPR
jgi:hypothetical protein